MLRSLVLVLVLTGWFLGAGPAAADEPTPTPAKSEPPAKPDAPAKPEPPKTTDAPSAPSTPAGVRNWGQAGAVPPAPSTGPKRPVSRPDPELSKAPGADRGPLTRNIDTSNLPPPSIRGRANTAPPPVPVPTPTPPPAPPQPAPKREPIVVAPPPSFDREPAAPTGAMEDVPAIETFPTPAPTNPEPGPAAQPPVADEPAAKPPAPPPESFVGNRIDFIEKTHNLQTSAGDLALRLDIRFTTRNQRGREVFVAMWFIDRTSGKRLVAADPAFSDVKGKLTAQSQATRVARNRAAFDATLIVPYRAFPRLGNLPTYEIDAQCLLLRREKDGMVRVLATGNTMFRVYGSSDARDPDGPAATDWSDPVPTEFIDKPSPPPAEEEDEFSDPSAPSPEAPPKKGK